MRKTVVTTLIVLVSVAALPARGAVELSSGPLPDYVAAEPENCTKDPVAWEQLPDGVLAVSTQDDICYPFVSEVADDFIQPADGVGAVQWWGAFWNGSPIPPDSFEISIYADDDGAPGARVHHVPTASFVETAGSDPRYPAYCGAANVFLGPAGCRYHVSVVASFCLPGQFGIVTGSGNGSGLHVRSALHGFEEWTPAEAALGAPHELAFRILEACCPPPGHTAGGRFCCLPDGTCEPFDGCAPCAGYVIDDCESCANTPTRRDSWGAINHLYR